MSRETVLVLCWSVLRISSLGAVTPWMPYCLAKTPGCWVSRPDAVFCWWGRALGIFLGQPQPFSVQTPIFNPTPIPCFSSCFECWFLSGCFCLVFKFLFLLYYFFFLICLLPQPFLVLVWMSNAIFCPGLISLSTLIPTHSVSMTTQPQHPPNSSLAVDAGSRWLAGPQCRPLCSSFSTQPCRNCVPSPAPPPLQPAGAHTFPLPPLHCVCPP